MTTYVYDVKIRLRVLELFEYDEVTRYSLRFPLYLCTTLSYPYT